MNESDGVEETTQAGMRMLFIGAARVAETLMRVRQQHLARAAAESAARAKDMQQRFEGEMLAARSAYLRVEDPQWWQHSRPEELAESYRTAAAWADVDPEAEKARRRMVDEISQRYGVDLTTTPVEEMGPELEAAAARLEHQASMNMVESSALLSAAERADQSGETEASNEMEGQSAGAWDSAERRSATAAELHAAINDPEAVEARMKADVAQGAPATEATRGAGQKAPKARRTTATESRQKQQSRGR